MISAKEFDEMFDKGESVDEYLDLENPLKLEDVIGDKIVLTIPKNIKERLDKIAKNLSLSIEDTIKVLLAKEVGIL